MSTPINPISETLLDLQLVTASEDFEANDRALQTITAQLTELDAVSATFDDEESHLTIEMTPLLVAIARNQMYLIGQLAEARGISEEAVRFDARAFLSSIDEG